MASLDFAKYTKTALSGLSVHFDETERETANHSNKNINKELSKTNYMIGTQSYRDSMERCLERTKAVDLEQPPKKVKRDRVIMDMCYIPCPNEIQDRDLFFQKSYDFLVERFGADNVHGGFVHKDEVHEYRDSRVRDKDDKQAIKLSMEHMHVMISPYTQEKGINSKAFNTKTMYLSIQKDFDTYIQQEFGIKYHTGQERLHESVESLKQATNELNELEAQNKRLQALKHEQEQLIQENANTLENASKQVEQAQQIVKALKGVESMPTLTQPKYFPTRAYERYEFKDRFLGKPDTYYKESDITKYVEEATNVYKENVSLQHELKSVEAQLSQSKQLNESLLSVDTLQQNVTLKAQNERLQARCSMYEQNNAKLAKEAQEALKRAEQAESRANFFEQLLDKALLFMHNLKANGKLLTDMFASRLHDDDQNYVNYISDSIEQMDASEDKGYER